MSDAELSSKGYALMPLESQAVSFETMHALEEEQILARREGLGITNTEPGAMGLALSGGGIRSATFNLGILQGLSAKGLLPGSTISQRFRAAVTSGPGSMESSSAKAMAIHAQSAISWRGRTRSRIRRRTTRSRFCGNTAAIWLRVWVFSAPISGSSWSSGSGTCS